MARSTLKRTNRLAWIQSYLKTFGSKTPGELLDAWRFHCSPSGQPPRWHLIVTVDTIARDLAFLVRQGKVRRFRSPENGHEWGGGRYYEFEVTHGDDD